MRVRFERVGKRFGIHAALREVDLDVEPGECVVLLGPSGCGKTTMLRLLAGLESADEGSLFIGDRRVNDVPPAERDVAMVFQNYALYPHFTVFDNVAFPLRARRVPEGEIAPRVRAAAARLELDTLLDRKPAQLSGGQQQRVALARAIVRNPGVYLMDEPLSNLDAQLRVQTRAELKRLRQELGTTTLYVTHDQGEAMTMGARVVVLRQGRVEQVDTPLGLYRQPANRFVATFLGSPAMNLWPGAVDGSSTKAAGVEVALDAARGAALAAAGPFDVGVRPEDVSLAASPGPGRAPARVVVVEPMGNETIAVLDAGGTRVVARGPADLAAHPGATLWFSVAPGRVLFFESATGRRIDGARPDG
ncbi:MAG: glycerol-3-phosphate ABC transporter ATP-binding protein [Acidobacteria bacterium]|nr:MAG: glycerol-3-phosphate ABC transporter ATP-binding protein [Acidobacteriota bacterium]